MKARAHVSDEPNSPIELKKQLEARTRELAEARGHLSEALEQQTAVSDILRLISNSRNTVRRVLESVAERAAHICQAQFVDIFLVEDNELRDAGWFGQIRRTLSLPLDRTTAGGRSVCDMRPVHVEDMQNAGDEFARGREIALKDGHRTTLGVPLIREGRALGTIIVRRTEVRPFEQNRTVVQIPDVNADPDYSLGTMATVGGFRSGVGVPILRDGRPIGSIALTRAQAGLLPDRQIELLKTFADQAVIAIENVRLFDEVQARTRELAQSVEELRALGEVSQAVNSTIDLETVLSTIVGCAVQLSGSDSGIVYEFDEVAQTFQARGWHRITAEHLAIVRAEPIRFGEGAVGRA